MLGKRGLKCVGNDSATYYKTTPVPPQCESDLTANTVWSRRSIKPSAFQMLDFPRKTGRPFVHEQMGTAFSNQLLEKKNKKTS